MDTKDIQKFLDSLMSLDPRVASGLLGWTIALFATTAVIAIFRKNWPMDAQGFAWPIAVFGLAWAARWWVENLFWLYEWAQVIFVVASPVALLWSFANLVRFLIPKRN